MSIDEEWSKVPDHCPAKIWAYVYVAPKISDMLDESEYPQIIETAKIELSCIGPKEHSGFHEFLRYSGIQQASEEMVHY